MLFHSVSPSYYKSYMYIMYTFCTSSKLLLCFFLNYWIHSFTAMNVQFVCTSHDTGSKSIDSTPKIHPGTSKHIRWWNTTTGNLFLPSCLMVNQIVRWHCHYQFCQGLWNWRIMALPRDKGCRKKGGLCLLPEGNLFTLSCLSNLI